MKTCFGRSRTAVTAALLVAAAAVPGVAAAQPAAPQPSSRAPLAATSSTTPDGEPVVGEATPVADDKVKKKDISIHWGEDDGGVSPSYLTLWYLEDGPLYASFKFAVFLEGTSGFTSQKAAPTICVDSTLTKKDANEGPYYIRLYNEYTPSGRSSAYSGWVSFPAVLNTTYQYCFPTSELPDFDRYDVFTAQFKKTNSTNYYYGHIKVFQK